MNYIDLFSGAGGFSLGFEQAGFKNIFALDIESEFCKTYQYNFPDHHLIKKDIKLITKEDILTTIKHHPKINVIIGGPPCQGFSMAGNIGRTFVDDERNHLFKEFVRVVDIVQPDFFIMENVARLYTHNKGKTRNEIIQAFNQIGYTVKAKILNSSDFGVPQHRNRVFFIGTNQNIDITFPHIKNSTHITIKDAIGHLPELKSGESYSNIPNHEAMNHSKQMLKKMSFIDDGGNRLSIPEELRPKSGDIRKYIKYKSSEPAICITGDMRKVFHYNQNRALTVRELAAIQTFPDSFVFKGSRISQQQQVGNAVPPVLAKIIANHIKELMINVKK